MVKYENGKLKWEDNKVVDQFKEWRGFTPILLVVITVLGAITSYFVIDKLNAMNDRSDRLFSIVGGIKNSFDDYKITAENRFTVLETKMSDIGQHLYANDNKRTAP